MSLEKSTTKFGHCCCFLSLSLSARGGEFHNQVWTFSSAEQRLLDARSEGGVEERRLEVSCSQTLYFVSVSLSHTHTQAHTAHACHA